ncbi:MAG TPA: oligosaccharide flippase family protein [Smithella sp.]|mgnify:FL=1|nr:oligosaccharide flippase family protein [Smithella sp.]
MSLIKPYINLFRFKSFDTSSEVGRSYERYRLIALSGSSSLISKIIISLIGLISIPLTINYLGKEPFGLWMVISSLIVWLQLTDFGIGNGLVNAIAEANGRNDKTAACSYFSTTFYSISGITLILAAPVVMITFFAPWDKVININNIALAQDAKYCFSVLSLFFFINMPLSIANKALVAYQKAYLVNITQIITSLCSLLFLIIAISMKLNLIWLVSLVSSGVLLGNIVSWILLYRNIPWLRLQLRMSSRHSFHRVAKSSVPLFLFQIGALLLNQSVNIILAHLAGLKIVADYNILLKIYTVVYSIGISFSSPFYPAIREAFEKKEFRWVSNAVKRVTALRLAILIIPAVLLVFVGDQLIVFWIRQPLSENFGHMGWLCFGICMILSGLSATLSEVLMVLDYIYSQLHTVFANAIVFISFSFLLVPQYSLAGFYMSFVISMIYPTLWALDKVRSVVVVK